MTKKVHVLLIEDDADFIYLVKDQLAGNHNLHFAGFATAAQEGVDMAILLQPDIAIVDLNLTGSQLDGSQVSKDIRLHTDARVLLLTSYEQPSVIIRESKRAFASGYIFKSQFSGLAETVYQTATTNTPQQQFIKELMLQDLSHAERKVLDSMLDRQKAIVSSQKTIANQKTSIFRKFGLIGLQNPTQALVHIWNNW